MIYILVLDTRGLSLDQNGIKEKLPPALSERVEKTKCEAEKRLRAGAYMLLCEAYCRYSEDRGITVEMPEIFYTGDGKPCFVDNNGLQKPPYFSISHDTELAVCALSDGETSVGVDVQSLPRGRVRLEKIAERFLAPLRRLDVQFSHGEAMGEVIYEDTPLVCYLFYEIKDGCLVKTPEELFCKSDITRGEAEADFLAKWTLLEAILKATGTGFGEASSVGALRDSVRSCTVTLSLNKRKYALTAAEVKTK